MRYGEIGVLTLSLGPEYQLPVRHLGTYYNGDPLSPHVAGVVSSFDG